MGGRKIDDHSFWAGAPSKGSVFPHGVHSKQMEAGPSGGELVEYFDSAPKIKEVQDKAVSKMKSYATKPGYRN